MEILLKKPGWLEKQSSCLKADINLKNYLSLGKEGNRKNKRRRPRRGRREVEEEEAGKG